MKKVLITNCENEVIEITKNDFNLFHEVATRDANFEHCEIHFERVGWIYLADDIREFVGGKITYIDIYDLEVWQKYFINIFDI